MTYMTINAQPSAETYDPTKTIVIRGQNADTYKSISAVDVENIINQNNIYSSRNESYRKKIDELESYLRDNYDNIDEDTLVNVANIFGISPTRTMRISMNVHFEVDVEVPIEEQASFDVNTWEWDFNAEHSSLESAMQDVEVRDWHEV